MKIGVIIAALLIVLTISLLKVERGQAISCGQVDSALFPCLGFLTGEDSPSAGCCDGVKKLKAWTRTTAERRSACECIKQAASRYATLNPDKATQLPQRCGVQIGVSITKDVNCNNVP